MSEKTTITEELSQIGLTVDDSLTIENTTRSLSKFGVPIGDGHRSGILMPALTHRFRVIYSTPANPIDLGRPLYEQNLDLTTDTVYCRFNMAQNRVEFGIRHNVCARMATFLDICRGGLEWIRLEGMDGGNEAVLHTILGNRIEIIEHHVDYDYGVSAAVVHHFVGRCHDIEVA
jgi:hypothetical protein